jgi:PAS domain S-box-containing protein
MAFRLFNAKTKLSESEHKFHSIFNHMREGAILHKIIHDDNGLPSDYILLEANPAMETNLGLAMASVIGKTSRDAYGHKEAPYLEIYARVAETGIPTSFETYFPPMNKYFSISVSSPEKGYFVTIFSNITERKIIQQFKTINDESNASDGEFRFQNEIILKNSYLKAVIETIPGFISLKDRESRYLLVNRHFLKACGSPDPDLVIGKTPFEVWPDNLASAIIESDRKVLESGEPLALEETLEIKGTHRLFEIFKTPVLGDNGSAIGLVEYSHDLTERIHSEKLLHESEDKYRALFTNTHSVMLLIDPLSGRIVDANQAAAGYYGYSIEELKSRNMADINILPPEEIKKERIWQKRKKGIISSSGTGLLQER